MISVGFTKHARDMLIERKFTEEQIVSIIENPDWREKKRMIYGMPLKGLETKF